MGRKRVEKESRDAALVSKFMDEMMPTKLFCRSPGAIFDYWVFWSHNHTSSINCDIQNGIKDAFRGSFNYTRYFVDDVLVQFWGAEEEIEGELHLTTALQPFALSNIENEKLKEYRKHCVGYKLLVADEASGIVGRVFRNQLPEFGPQPEYYSVNEYPQRDFAIRCGIKSIQALPVFQHPGLACVGVLELLSPIPTAISRFEHVESVNLTLKKQRLSTTDMLHFFSQINQTYTRHIQDEIQTAVKQVCWTHRLALGVIWVSFQGELLVPIPKMSFVDKGLVRFLDHWSWSGPLRVDQGLVGKTFSSRDLYYCRDVSQLSISDYPQVLFARKFGLAACFTACLWNISTGNHELVIEFSLSRETTYNQDLHSLFFSILATMNQQLRSFKVVTGDMYIDIANETHKQREQSSNELTSYMTISTPTTSEADIDNETSTDVHKQREQSNNDLTSYMTISTPTTSEADIDNETSTDIRKQREQSNNDLTSFKTISRPTTSEGNSLQSRGTTGCSMMSTCKKPDWPSLILVNESDQFIPESSFPVNTSAQRAESECSGWGKSETASTNWVTLFGYKRYGHQSNTLPINRSRAESLAPGTPLSEASAIYPDGKDKIEGQ